MDVGYSAGMMNKRAVFAKRKEDRTETWGKNGNPKYVLLGEFWVAEDFNRGTKSLREGAFDAYDTVMFRMDYDDRIDRWCLIQYNGKWYQIQSFNEDYQSNKIQITAIELANQQVNIDYTGPAVAYGFGESAQDVYEHGTGINPKTAVGTYQATATQNGQWFFILVRNDLAPLKQFTMGGAPLVMDAQTTIEINHETYFVRKSANWYNAETKLIVSAT